MPAPLLNRPYLKVRDARYKEAFDVLHSSRTQGFSGQNSIQVSEILAYLELVGIDSQQERVKYLRLIQKLDDVYFAYVAEKRQATKA